MKKIFKSAVSFAIPLSMCLFGSVTAGAAPVETTEEAVREEAAVTSAVTSTAAAVSETPEHTETSAPVTESAAAETTIENPYEDGMLADDELFNFISGYLNDNVSFDVDGSGVLIGEDILNPEPDAEDGEAEENSADKSGAFSDYYTGEKLMYTVATRDGSIFYIIIDKSGAGENVYFLNSVDFTDLAALVDTEKENLSKAEKDILQAADENVDRTDDEETENNTEENNDSSSVGSSSVADNTTTASGGGNNTMYIVLAIAAIGIIGVAAYFKVGPGKKKMAAKSAFDDSEGEEEEDDDGEEEYYVEDENEESREQGNEAPQEDSYEENYDEDE